MSEALQLILAEIREVRSDVKDLRDDVRETHDAAVEATSHSKALDGHVGELMGDIANCRKKSEEAISRVQAVEVRLDERRVEKAAKWAFAGSAIIALCGLVSIVWQTMAKADTPAPAGHQQSHEERSKHASGALSTAASSLAHSAAASPALATPEK